jgi:sarcosine oxidase, subunit alpha
VDENPYVGGALSYARFDAEGQIAWQWREKLLLSLAEEKRINVVTDATCTGCFADNWLSVLKGDRLYKIRARNVVFATGCIEQPLVFRNNDLPGVVYGSAVQRLLRLYGVRPGTRALILAGHDDAYGVALDLYEAEVDVAAVIELRPQHSSCDLAREVERRGIRISSGTRVDQALPDRSGHRVGACVVDGVSFNCDLVCMAGGYVPAYHLAAQSGARVSYDPSRETFATVSCAGIRLAGSANGMSGLVSTMADGARAGSAASVNASSVPGLVERSPQLAWPIFRHRKGKEFVDFDEDLQISDLVLTARAGYNHLELLKRFSTVGMGPSQGRHSALNTARIVAEVTGQPKGEVGVTTARPPLIGEPLRLLAGQGFHPERLTPMHHRHVELGAHMMAVGPWWRPQFYGHRSEAERVIDDEIATVHESVGMIDVSTLGKFEIRGPDAAEFLDRLYTFRFAKQPVGRIRYLLMTNEAGTIVDDGVAARLSDQHFYVTGTTGAADHTFRQMQWWNAQWRLRIDIANMTSGFAAINVVGPRARDVLRKLQSEVDLSPEAFPYLHCREGTIEGIPARLLRIGFLGELGYEIHVPNSFGEALWDLLRGVGAASGLKPIGVEAQRRLRLEKGHIIVGQDTDGLTTPSAAHLDWAVANEKAFFVGARSLRARGQFPRKRELAGFTLPAGDPVPAESCLIVEDEQMVGVVTSATRSRVCNAVVGLALLEPRLAAVGTRITVRLSDGKNIGAKVVRFPFYDSENQRQSL